MKAPSFDNAKTLLLVAGVGVLAYAAWRAYQSAQAGVAGLQGAYTGALNTVSNAYDRAGNAYNTAAAMPGGGALGLGSGPSDLYNWIQRTFGGNSGTAMGSTWQFDDEERYRQAQEYFRYATPAFLLGDQSGFPQVNSGNLIFPRRFDDLSPPVIDYASGLPAWGPSISFPYDAPGDTQTPIDTGYSDY